MKSKDISLIKNYYEKLCILCDELDRKKLWNRPDTEAFKLKNIFRHDIGEYIMYLSSSDGCITNEESDVYKLISGYEENIDKMKDYIRNHGLYSERYKSEVPLSICLVTECEQTAIENGITLDLNVNKSYPDLFIDFFTLMAKVLIEVDGEIAIPEETDASNYLNMLRGHIIKNTNSINYYQHLVLNLCV